MIEQIFEFIGNHPILVGTFIALFIALLVVEGRRAGIKLTPQEAVQKLNRDEAIVVDIRERKEFSEGHIKGALHIPLARLNDSKDELRRHEGKMIILVDKAGQHSSTAGKILKGENLEVARISGGMMDWRNANLPVSRGEGKTEKKGKSGKKKA